MSGNDRQDTTRVTGTLRLSAWHINDVADETGGYRRRYGYLIESTESGATYEGDDLHSGVGVSVDATLAVRTLASFLSAAGESYRHVLKHPDSEPENLDLFPLWVAEAAYLNAEELAFLDLDDEGLEEAAAGPAAPSRFIGVVFQQGDDATETLTILNERGWQGAVEHLAAWDSGNETEEAAEANGQVYSEVPIGERDTICVSGDYVMTYNRGLSYVGLVRRIDSLPDRTAASSVNNSGQEAQLRGQNPAADAWSWDESPWERPWSSRPVSGPVHPPQGI